MNIMKYRVNFGNGQVSSTFSSRSEAFREKAIADRNGRYAWVQFYDAESAGDLSKWVIVWHLIDR